MFIRIVSDYIVYFIYFIPDLSVVLLIFDINLFSFIFFFHSFVIINFLLFVIRRFYIFIILESRLPSLFLSLKNSHKYHVSFIFIFMKKSQHTIYYCIIIILFDINLYIDVHKNFHNVNRCVHNFLYIYIIYINFAHDIYLTIKFSNSEP